MIKLDAPKNPFVIDLAPGISVTVKPVTSLSMGICKVIARKLLDDIKNGVATVEKAGLIDGIQANLDDPYLREALYDELLLKEIAVRHFDSWQGVTVNDSVAELTEENIRVVVTLWPFNELLYKKLTEQMIRLHQAKKDSGTGASGISNVEPVPNTAKDAS